jgi:hypothetical protein
VPEFFRHEGLWQTSHKFKVLEQCQGTGQRSSGQASFRAGWGGEFWNSLGLQPNGKVRIR